MSDIPKWALLRADDLARESHGGYYRKAFGLYISQHEDEPVDPRIGEAAQKIASDWGSTAGLVFVEACIKRGMELAQEDQP